MSSRRRFSGAQGLAQKPLTTGEMAGSLLVIAGDQVGANAECVQPPNRIRRVRAQRIAKSE